MLYYTADEHYFHRNIIKLVSRPFSSLKEMHTVLISNHNSKVTQRDVVIHVGDFSFGNKENTLELISKLNGRHIFLLGDHDSTLSRLYKNLKYVNIRKHNKRKLIACHWPFRTWAASHYGSINLHGHSHGHLQELPNQLDVGVDANNFFPISINEIFEKIKSGYTRT